MNYVPWYRKKRLRRAKHERDFFRLLKTGANGEAIAEAVEELRAANIRVLRAQRAQLAPAEPSLETIQRLDREIERWATMSTEAIVDAYRARLTHA